jgi:ABC-type phosphate transport system substrate-binding protein
MRNLKPQPPRRTLERIKQEGAWNITSRLQSVTGYFWSKVYSVIPWQMRSLLPFITEDVEDLFRAEPEAEPAEAPLALSEEKGSEDFSVTLFSHYEKYRCPLKNPLNCEEAQQAVEEDRNTKHCLKCGFPAILPEKAEIQGKQGRYQILKYLGSRGLGRLYLAEHIGESRRVTLKEYLLPKRHFNEKEGIKTQKIFESVGSIELADGRQQTGRILAAKDAIADRLDRERCYLIARDVASSYPTLRAHLVRTGAMNSRQLRHFLNQTLQSLEYLHGQKFRLPNGQIQTGIVHGNLSLDSLLISPLGQPFFHDPQFFIYLCDFALWETIFTPLAAAINPTPAKDLKALGSVSFYLLAGGTKDPSDRPLSPQVNQHWPKLDIPLKLFLFRLLELDTPFASATEARQALLRLPLEAEIVPEVPAVELAADSTSKRKRSWLWWLIAFLALSLLAGGLAWLLSRRQAALAESREIRLCCISEVSAVPAGRFTFTAERYGLWNYLWRQPNLVQKDRTLEAELTDRRPQLQLNYRPTPTGEGAIAEVREGKADFAITSLTDGLSSDLNAQTFAYDGLAVFVAFSYEQRDRALPKYLQGKITFKQLQQLYTGQITNWQQLGGPDLLVRLYIPASQEAVRIFEQRVLQDKELITEFRKLAQAQNISKSSPKLVQMPTLQALRTVLQDFENEQVGAIGFGPLSQVFGQCSAYPLALGSDNSDFVQPLNQGSGQAIDPTTDLCNKKGGYFPNFEVFQTGHYPLAYPLAAVYRRDNRRPPIGRGFANILKTQESQQLLKKTGVVPLEKQQ